MTSSEPGGKPIVILGVFVADTAYRAERQPRLGETILGEKFVLGPGGKGSNQAVAAGRLGARVNFITRLGQDPFADMARQTWEAAGVTPAVIETPESYTGAAYIFIEEATGNNAIIVCPGAARLITPADIDDQADLVRDAGVFVTQLEQPLDAAERALEIARAAGVTTILNPAPADNLPQRVYGLCDYVTPNESEVEGITGIKVEGLDDARRAAEALLARGVGAAVVTLGENGALLHSKDFSEHLPEFRPGPSSRPPVPATPSTAAWPWPCRGAARRRKPCALPMPLPASPSPGTARHLPCPAWKRSRPCWGDRLLDERGFPRHPSLPQFDDRHA